MCLSQENPEEPRQRLLGAQSFPVSTTEALNYTREVTSGPGGLCHQCSCTGSQLVVEGEV